MFNAETYVQRRKALKERMKSGVLFFPGNEESPLPVPFIETPPPEESPQGPAR